MDGKSLDLLRSKLANLRCTERLSEKELLSWLEGRGIRVTVAFPGEMSTGLFAEHPSWERRPDFQRRMEVPPERVARAILRAVRGDRFEVVAPLTMRLPLLLQRMAPRFFRRGVARFYRRVFAPRIAP